MKDFTPLEWAGEAAAAARWAAEMRDRFIVGAHEAGWSYREIGQQTGLEPRAVEEIVRADR